MVASLLATYLPTEKPGIYFVVSSLFQLNVSLSIKKIIMEDLSVEVCAVILMDLQIGEKLNSRILFLEIEAVVRVFVHIIT